MQNIKLIAYAAMLLFALGIVHAATIYGNVYDLSLRKLNNVKIEINTIPKQAIVAQNGSYSFNVPNGDYVIKAQLLQKNTVLAFVQENITIRQDGSYVLDLILFPELEEGIEEIDIDVGDDLINEANNKNVFVVSIAIILLLAAAFFGAIYHFNKRKSIAKEAAKDEEHASKDEDKDINHIIKFINQEGGRTTQKEIRKQIPLSEAKISLMIAELQHKGIIEKIKKGRGNIVILKKK